MDVDEGAGGVTTYGGGGGIVMGNDNSVGSGPAANKPNSTDPDEGKAGAIGNGMGGVKPAVGGSSALWGVTPGDGVLAACFCRWLPSMSVARME